MATKVEANISEFLDFTQRRFINGFKQIITNANDYFIFNDLGLPNDLEEIHHFSDLNWISPIYDDKQSSYNLIFSAPKTSDNPPSTFTITHKSSGDYIGANYIIGWIDSGDNSEHDYHYDKNGKRDLNGKVNDSLTASFGSIDKTTFTIDEVGSYQSEESYKNGITYNQNTTSSNNTIDDKSDDYTRATTYSEISMPIGSGSVKYTDTYKSKNLNYTILENYSQNYYDINSLTNKDKITNTGKIIYSKYDSESNSVVNANWSYSSSENYSVSSNDSSYTTFNSNVFSNVAFKVISDDAVVVSDLKFTGEIKKDYIYSSSNSTHPSSSVDIYMYNFKNFSFETQKFKMTSNSISYDEITNSSDLYSNILNLTTFNKYNENNTLPTEMINSVITSFRDMNKGDNTINIKNADGELVDAGNGKDIVIGGLGDDTIIGGAGSDKLTGGKGTDTFSFSKSDFYSVNSNGDYAFNKSTDIVTDFSLKDIDVLEFGDLGQLSFCKTLSEAKEDNASLFYVKGTGKIYLNTNDDYGFTPTVIITLTGKPALNADGTDWNYPA